MQNFKIATIFLAAIFAFASCNGGGSKEPQTESGAIAVPDKENVWTYVSLESGKVVGTCEVSDTLAQKSWASRKDWDIAICNGHIRTNSGASGVGSGGIMRTETAYEEIENLRAGKYFTDIDTVTVAR